MEVSKTKIEELYGYFYDVILENFEDEFPDEDKRNDFAVQLLDGFEAYREPEIFMP